MEPTSNTPSASPEPDFEDALVGVDPDDVIEVKIGPSTFVLRPMTALQWEELSGRQIAIRNAAFARAVQMLTDEGKDPSQPLPGQDPDKEAVLVTADERMIQDLEYRKVQNEVMLQAVVWSLMSHRAFKNRKNEPFPCVHGADGFLDAKTKAVFARNADICSRLWLHMVRLNSLDTTSKKSSR